MEKKLKRIEFNILVRLLEDKDSINNILIQFKESKENINNIIKDLETKGYLKNNVVTNQGIEALKPYKVKRAIFLAAGFGSRLSPITINTPKPLIRVNGKRIIDGLIDAVLNAGIEEIIIVRGYLSEQFDQLLYKYPMIKFIDNKLYDKANNISSALCVKDMLENAYVFEADLLIHNNSIIHKYHFASNFLGIKTKKSEDWCFETKDNIIVNQTIGGVNCYQEVGISYWNQKDGKKLAKDILETFEQKDGPTRYWDQVPFVFYKEHYNVEINECNANDIIEIDTLDELKAIDGKYLI